MKKAKRQKRAKVVAKKGKRKAATAQRSKNKKVTRKVLVTSPKKFVTQPDPVAKVDAVQDNLIESDKEADVAAADASTVGVGSPVQENVGEVVA